jgi:hypothetical protein
VSSSEERQPRSALSFHELRRAIDAFLTGPMADSLRAVECKAPSHGDRLASISTASVAEARQTLPIRSRRSATCSA